MCCRPFAAISREATSVLGEKIASLLACLAFSYYTCDATCSCRTANPLEKKRLYARWKATEHRYRCIQSTGIMMQQHHRHTTERNTSLICHACEPDSYIAGWPLCPLRTCGQLRTPSETTTTSTTNIERANTRISEHSLLYTSTHCRVQRRLYDWALLELSCSLQPKEIRPGHTPTFEHAFKFIFNIMAPSNSTVMRL